MIILSKEKVPKNFEHKIKQVICDNKQCNKDITINDNYYEVKIDRDDGEQGYVETIHFCEDCVKKVLPTFIGELEHYQDLTVSCYKRHERQTKKVSEIDEQRGYFYDENMRFEKQE